MNHNESSVDYISLSGKLVPTRADLSVKPLIFSLSSEGNPSHEDSEYFTISIPNINLDMVRIHSTTLWHEAAVLCLTAYLLLQNAFGITDVINHYFESEYPSFVDPLRYTAYILLLPCTVVAVLLSKALKIIEIPRRVYSWAQETLLREIEKELIKKKNNNLAWDQLVIAIFKEEFDKEITKKAEVKYGFYYTLNILAKRYGTSLSFLIIKPEQSLADAMTAFLSKKHKTTNICVLPYSTQYIPSPLQASKSQATMSTISLTPPHTPRKTTEDSANTPLSSPALSTTETQLYALTTPSFGARRLWSAYAPKVNSSVIVAEVSFWAISTLYLGIIPIAVSLLQGNGTLANASGVDENSPWMTQSSIFLAGAVIGLIRGWVTYKQKADDAEERFRNWLLACYTLVFDSPTTFNLSLNSAPACLPTSISECWTRIKQFFCISFGVYAALGTVVFYAGLGFFFSNSGLVTAMRLMGLQPLSTELLFSISANFCLGQVLLNAIGNQGPDIIERYWLRAIGEHKKETASAKTCTEHGLSLAVKGDAISTGLSADSGALSLLQLLWPFLPYEIVVPITLSICLALVFSQNTFAWTSGKKDYHLWKMLWEQRYKPCINSIIGCVPSFFCSRAKESALDDKEVLNPFVNYDIP